jgi:PAS domain S-box-containing protein
VTVTDKRLSILIVEDSESDTGLILRQVQQAHYNVSHERVETADQMRSALERQPWDVIIADYSLPQFDAPSALAVLQKSGLDIPFIVVSGTIGEETAIALMKAGAHDCIMKHHLPRLIPVMDRELSEVQIRQAKRQAEDKIRQTAEEWVKTFDAMSDLISIQNLEYQLVRVNQSYARAVKTDPDALVGKRCYEVMHGTICPPPLCACKEMLLTKKPVSVEIFEPHLGMYLEVSTSPIFDVNGVMTDFVHIIKDITARKESELELRKSTERFHVVAKATRDAVWDWDLVTGRLWWNEEFCALFGYSADEIEPGIESWHTRIHPEDMGRTISGIQAAITDGKKIWSDEYRFRRKDGSYATVFDRGFILHDEKVTPVRMIGSMQDITARKDAETALNQNVEKLRTSLIGTIKALSMTVEARDPYTAGHQAKVSKLARAIAQDMALSNDTIDNIRIAGIIHDIGKISVPSEILSKPGKLSDIEFSIIKNHSQSGYCILEDAELPYPIAEIVLQHHERLDGSGYPQGLKNGQILLESQIIMVADVVEAMASHRPYRPALGIGVALEEIEKNKGIFYDTGVVDVCLKLFREGGFKFE